MESTYETRREIIRQFGTLAQPERAKVLAQLADLYCLTCGTSSGCSCPGRVNEMGEMVRRARESFIASMGCAWPGGGR